MPAEKQVDPVIERFVRDLQATKRPDQHSRNSIIDQMAADLPKHPDLFYRSKRQASYMEALLLVATKVREIVADKLGNPEFKDEPYLTVALEEDWQLYAEVEREPPYHIYVSTNLYRFCARLSELFIAGLTLTLTDDDGKPAQPRVEAPLSHAEVVARVKAVLDAFIRDRTIPDEEATLTPEHSSIRDIVFYAIMASLVGHEFGHVVINQERISGKTDSAKRYRSFVDGLLRSNAQRLLYTPMHDPDDRVGFGKLDRRELQAIAERWIDEMTADLIGVDLARTYHRDFGPARGKPGVVAATTAAIHLGFIAQLFLYVYLNHRDPAFPLTSRTHPPIDFRLHCVVSWLYENPQDPAVMSLINYTQRILDGVLAD